MPTCTCSRVNFQRAPTITRSAKTKNPARGRGSSRPDNGGEPLRIHARSAAEWASTLTRTLRTFLCFIDAQRAAIHLKAVQRLDGALRFVLRHVDKTEAARLSGLTVIDELDRIHLAVTLEEAPDVLLCRVEG